MHSIRVRNSDTVILFSNAMMAEDRLGVQTRAMTEAQHTEEETQKQLDNQQEQIQRDNCRTSNTKPGSTKPHHERSQNTVPIASTQVAIKGIVQYSTRAQFLVGHSREHTLSTVGPDAQVE